MKHSIIQLSKKFSLILIFICFSLISSCGFLPQEKTVQNNLISSDNCQVSKAGLDMGSGSTKYKIAIVDICKKTIFKILKENEYKINFKNNLSQSKDLKIIPEDIEQARNVIQEFLNEAKKQNVQKNHIFGIATAAFREARNGEQLALDWSKEFNFSFNVINQEEEAKIGYLSALLALDDQSPPYPVVWDIGGGSQQISFLTEDKNFIYYGNETASVSFKNYIIEKVKKNKSLVSPNPMTPKELNAAFNIAYNDARKKMTPSLKNILQAQTQMNVIGIGGVFSYSLKDQTGSSNLTLKSLTETMARQAYKSDQQIQSRFADTDVTNLALVAGYMKALKIQKVTALKANNTLGLFFYKDFFK